MARFCSKCNSKIGFFEEDFDGMCKNCYNESIEQERMRIEEEQKRKIKEEEERRLEEQRKKEEEKRLEQKRIEERNKQIEEEIRLEKLEKERKKQERERRKQEEQKRKNELLENKKRIILEFLKKKISSNYPIYDMYKFLSYRDKIYIENRLKLREEYKNSDYSLFITMVLEYLTMLECFDNISIEQVDTINLSLEQVKQVFKNKNILYSIIKKYIKSADDKAYNDIFDDDFGFSSFRKKVLYSPETLEAVEKIIKKCIELCNDTNIESYIRYILLSDEESELEEKIETLLGYDSLEDDEMTGCLAYIWLDIMHTFCFAYIFCYVITLTQYDFKVNEELNKIYIQLSSRDLDNNYIMDKIYGIYENLYSDIYNIKLSKSELGIIACIANQYEFISYYIDEEDNKIIVTNFLKSKNETTKNLDNESLKEILTNLDMNDIFIKLKSLSITNYEYPYYCIINDIILLISEYISAKLFFYMNYHIEDFFSIMKIKEEEYNKELILQERDRYLAGDFGIEDKMIEEKYEYEQIQNGYEFEEYVATLYKKIGYTIEEVTKKSGDQRSRHYST